VETTFKLKLTLKEDTQVPENALYGLECWLREGGISIEKQPPVAPAADEQGLPETVAIVVVLTVSTLHESIEVTSDYCQHQKTPIVLCLTGQEDVDKSIREEVKNKPFIELCEPESPSVPDSPPENEQHDHIDPREPKPPLGKLKSEEMVILPHKNKG